MLSIEGVPAKSSGELESALREELRSLATTPVSPEELERAKAQAVASEVYARDSLFRQAMEMGQFEAAGRSWREVEHVPERLRAVTAEELRELAQRYLKEDGLTVGVLEPQPPQKGARR